jgi:hypothetical protein
MTLLSTCSKACFSTATSVNEEVEALGVELFESTLELFSSFNSTPTSIIASTIELSPGFLPNILARMLTKTPIVDV